MLSAVVLAAGMSTRMGQNKLLLNFREKPLIVHAVGTLLASEIDEVIVVLGHETEKMRDQLERRVGLANKAAAQTLGLPLDEVVGKSLVDLAGPVEDIERTITDFNSGRFVGVHSHRSIHAGGGGDRPILATSRAILPRALPRQDDSDLGREPDAPHADHDLDHPRRDVRRLVRGPGRRPRSQRALGERLQPRNGAG